MPEETKNPKLAAVEAELASDRGEVYDPNSETFHEVHTFGVETDVDSLIDAASIKAAELPKQKTGLRKDISFDWLKRLVWKPKPEPKKDYRYEFDPKTGGERRLYVIRDGRTDREKD